MIRHLSICLLAFVFLACNQESSSSDATNENKAKDETSASDTPADTPTRKYVEVGAGGVVSNKDVKVAKAELSGCSDSEMKGTVLFSDQGGQVTLTARMSNVKQGTHGFHIHAVGDCSSADGKSAGGHWNPTGVEHGKWGTPPFHKGDIGNFEADKNGNGSIDMTTDLWCVGCGDEEKDVLGKAIIVHAGKDDCSSQPSGAAGARIACGVIEVSN